jgi:hypothetical protein
MSRARIVQVGATARVERAHARCARMRVCVRVWAQACARACACAVRFCVRASAARVSSSARIGDAPRADSHTQPARGTRSSARHARAPAESRHIEDDGELV